MANNGNKNKIEVGDTVRFLNAVGGGRVARIKDGMAYVEDDDGFETPMLLRECVVVAAPKQPTAPTPAPKSKKPEAIPAPAPAPKRLPVVEVEGGDVLNLVIGFEPTNIKALSISSYDCYLVNDSNYYVSFAFMSRQAGDSQWTLRHAATVEPNIQLLMGTFTPADIAQSDNLCLQAVAYKTGNKTFDQKPPVNVEIKVDTTKFFKLHCFRQNTYFEAPVIAFDVVRDDIPVTPRPAVATDDRRNRELEEALNAKKRVDRRQVRRRPVPKATVADDGADPLVVDLHIAELLDNVNGLSSADILNYQIDQFRKIMDANLTRHGRHIIFIHGKGEGVLRQALTKEMAHRYKMHRADDAPFAQYAGGAMQITIK